MPPGMHLASQMRQAEHEKLEVYHRAARVAAQLHEIAQRIPRTRGDARLQLRRASLSIPLNIAEGAGEYLPAAKAQFYRIARRSATECMSILDVMSQIEKDPARYRETVDELRVIASALTGLAVSQERREGKE